MPTNYDDLYAWMHAAFGAGEFTIQHFRGVFPSPAPEKVLFDLRRLGYVDRIRRGTYRLVPPETRLQRVTQRSDRLDLPEGAGLPYAYSDATAIAVWTDGGYWTGFTAGFRPTHMDVRGADVQRWKDFLHAAGAKATVEGDRETLYGVVYVLHPVPRVRSVRHAGVRVIPKRTAHASASSRPYLYEPVLSLLAGATGR